MKGSLYSTSIILFSISIFLNTFAAHAGLLCHSNQRDLLLAFKNEFQALPDHSCSFYSDDLCSAKHWEKEEDCCSWNGITCDAKSGEVIELNASCCFYGHFNSNSSLFRLKSLRSLNLAYNNFNSSLLPTQFSKLLELTHLNLSLSSFSGQIPTEFLHLTKLVFLDLSYNFHLSFEKSFFSKFTQSFTNLEELNLGMVNISSEIPQNISNLSSLRSLNLKDCSLFGKLPRDFFLLPNIQSISVSSNQNLEGSLPEFHGNNSLVTLDLSSTSLSGNIPDSISNLKHLNVMILKSCEFSEKIPSSIGNLSYLTTLDLSYNHFIGTIPSSIGYLSSLTTLKLSYNGFSGLIPSSIGNLSQLTNLPLSSNNFTGQIPSSLGNLLHLTDIDLSYNQFSGHIPSSLGNLSRLVSLNLYINNFVGEIPSSFGNLNQLTSLLVMRNKLSGNFPIKLLNLTELSNLELSQNQFTGMLPPNMSSLSNLEYFSAFENAFTGTLPSSLFNIPNLTSVYLGDNQFNGLLEFGNISSPSMLKWLYIGNNNFRGPIPRSIFSLTNLISLDLSNLNTEETTVDFCSFSHLKSLKDLHLSHLNTTTMIDLNAVLSCLSSLSQLVLSGNHVVSDANKSSVSVPPSQSLISILKLSGCNITEFPEFIRHQQNLINVDLSNNNIKDQVPSWLWNLPDLRFVDLSNNIAISFERSSYNFSSYPVPAANMYVLPSPLTRLTLLGCNITRVPEFIKRHQSIASLDLSNNKIKGQVPGWLWRLPNLMHLDLSNNFFIGFEGSTKPGVFSFPTTSMKFLLGSNNYFDGEIPSFICALRSLTTLDLSSNNFNGPIPRCMQNLKNTLAVLNLRQNRLSGTLPAIIFDSLRSLDVSHNQLMGKLPRSLIRFSTLEVLNVGNNEINDTFPFWLSSLQELQVLVLRSNAFYGPIHQASFPKLRIIDISRNHFNGALQPEYFVNWSAMSSLETNQDWSTGKYMAGELGFYHDSIVLMNKGIEMEFVRILTIYTALDFSGNQLRGGIPRSIGLLKGLHSLNMSNNAFTGHIPSSMVNLIELESLDVSQNKLSGEIPQEIGNLSYLAYMNFSHNQLVGPVPGGTQFRRQPCSSFEDNPGLYGPSLDEVCVDIHAKTSQQSETPEPEENEEEFLSWRAAAIGFGPGVALGLTIGYILVSYKPEWFMHTFGRNKRRG